MNKTLIYKLNNKYNYIIFKKKKNIKIGSLISLNLVGGLSRQSFTGILIKYKKNKNFTTFVLRNSYKKYSFEKTFILNNPMILMFKFHYKVLNKKINRNNLYYLRNRKRTYSSY